MNLSKKGWFFVGIILFCLLMFAGYIRANVNVIKNSSFENPGIVWPVLTPENCPDDWNDIFLPPDRYGGWVYTNWPTDGDYNLDFFSYGRAIFTANEIGMISQHIPLAVDVYEIRFDVKLSTSLVNEWHPLVRTAVVCIDNEVVWESNNVGSDVRGEYYNQGFVVPEKYKDGQSHKLSLGIRIDAGGYTEVEYFTDWDNVHSIIYCDGLGLLVNDFNRDCRVDFADFAEWSKTWLADNGSKSNGFINFRDFALYTGGYTRDVNNFDFAGFTDVWLKEVEPNNIYNLFIADEPNSAINFFDFTTFAKDWRRSSYD